MMATLRITELPPNTSVNAVKRFVYRQLAAVEWQPSSFRVYPTHHSCRNLINAHVTVPVHQLDAAITALQVSFKRRQLVVEQTAASQVHRSPVQFYLSGLHPRTTAADVSKHLVELTKVNPLATTVHKGRDAEARRTFAFAGMPAGTEDLVLLVHRSVLKGQQVVCRLAGDSKVKTSDDWSGSDQEARHDTHDSSSCWSTDNEDADSTDAATTPPASPLLLPEPPAPLVIVDDASSSASSHENVCAELDETQCTLRQLRARATELQLMHAHRHRQYQQAQAELLRARHEQDLCMRELFRCQQKEAMLRELL